MLMVFLILLMEHLDWENCLFPEKQTSEGPIAICLKPSVQNMAIALTYLLHRKWSDKIKAIHITGKTYVVQMCCYKRYLNKESAEIFH